jgi:hypothetical protein
MRNDMRVPTSRLKSRIANNTITGAETGAPIRANNPVAAALAREAAT